MRLKDLIFSLPKQDILSALASAIHLDPEKHPQAIQRRADLIDRLLSIEPVETNSIILGIMRHWEGDQSLEACLFRKSEIAKKFDPASPFSTLDSIDQLSDEEAVRQAAIPDTPKSVSLEYEPWEEVLGCEIDERNAAEVGPLKLCVAVIAGMTLLGLDETAIAASRKELKSPPPDIKAQIWQEVHEIRRRGPSEHDPEEAREGLTYDLETYKALQKYLAQKKS